MSNIGIYMIENRINGKLYIGQTNNLSRRHKRHFSDLRANIHPNPHLQHSFNKYGEENFNFKIILCCEEDDLTYFEDFFIKFFNSKNYGYNICDANRCFPDNSGANNGMYGKQSPNRRTDLDKNISHIAKQYKNGVLIKDLAKEWGTNRKILRQKLRTIFSKEEMEQINKQNQKSANIPRNKHKGHTHNLKARINMSKSNNTTGYYRVSFDKTTNRYCYSYYLGNKRKKITANSIEILKEKVINKQLEWIKY